MTLTYLLANSTFFLFQCFGIHLHQVIIKVFGQGTSIFFCHFLKQTTFMLSYFFPWNVKTIQKNILLKTRICSFLFRDEPIWKDFNFFWVQINFATWVFKVEKRLILLLLLFFFFCHSRSLENEMQFSCLFGKTCKNTGTDLSIRWPVKRYCDKQIRIYSILLQAPWKDLNNAIYCYCFYIRVCSQEYSNLRLISSSQ